MNKDALLSKIQELSFAKTEAELFLDTHPDCAAALDFYRRTVRELEDALTEYNNVYGPLTADAVSGERWSWIDTPWPWQLGDISNPTGKGGKR